MSYDLEANIPIQNPATLAFADTLWATIRETLENTDLIMSQNQGRDKNQERYRRLLDASKTVAPTKYVAEAAARVFDAYFQTADSGHYWLRTQFWQTDSLSAEPFTLTNTSTISFTDEDCESIAIMAAFTREILRHENSDDAAIMWQQCGCETSGEATVFYIVATRDDIVWREASMEAQATMDALRKAAKLPGVGTATERARQAVHDAFVARAGVALPPGAEEAMTAMIEAFSPEQLVDVYEKLSANAPDDSPRDSDLQGVRP